MSKASTTLTIDEDVLRAVRILAARVGKSDSEVIEESLRRDLSLGLVDRIGERNDLSDRAANELAIEAQHATRRRKPR